MANPQAENGHVRIANEILNEILRRSFSKRQIAILHFIWRLSYGCNKKYAYIPKLKHFSLCGVTNQNIKSELEHLEVCNVILWNRETNEFRFNKDYEKWIITPIKYWDEEEFKKLIHLNIIKKSPKEDSKNTKKVLKIRTEKSTRKMKSSQNKKRPVLKIRNYGFLKQEIMEGANPCLSKANWTSKYIIKDNIKDNKRKEEEDASDVIDPTIKTLIDNHIISPAFITPTLLEDLNDITDNFGFEDPELMIQEAVKDAVRGNGRTWKFVYNKLNTWRKQGIKNMRDLERFNGNTIPFTPKKRNANSNAKEILDKFRRGEA